MEADHRPASHHNDTLLCDIRTIHRLTYRRGRGTLVYGVHRARTRDDVSDYELVLACGVVVLYGEVPEDDRRDTRIPNPILDHHIRIYHRMSYSWDGHRGDRPRCGDVFYFRIICSYWSHIPLCTPHFASLRTHLTPELTRCR